MNYKMILQYDGTRYNGWQKQGNTKNTIQGKIEEMHCKESLSDLYECLAGRGFEYAHNSYIVNLAKVEGLEKNVALLPFGIQLNVSRSRKGQFADALITFLGERNGMV